jgi:hypothetical protein
VLALSGRGKPIVAAQDADDVDVDAVLEERGCKDAFEAVQECMADTNRDWAKCQTFVQAWKACFAENPNSSGGSVGDANKKN